MSPKIQKLLAQIHTAQDLTMQSLITLNEHVGSPSPPGKTYQEVKQDQKLETNRELPLL